MKFPSWHSLYISFISVIKRFPFVIAFALLGCIAATICVEVQGVNNQLYGWCIRLIMVADLGLVLSLSARLFSESRNFSSPKRYGLTALAVLLAAVLLFALDPLRREADYLRFLLLALAFHLLVAYVAFIGKNQLNAFWQFNKTLFLRFATGALYSGVLFLGLAAAIGSMNLLFNFKFEWDTFAILWFLIVGLFQTVFFLSGVPQNIAALEHESSYPKGLKLFTQYVLLPLASVYVVILLAYELKILIQWSLPKGLVSNLIIGYAVFGLLALLLIYPIRNLEENKWLKTYSRNFYFLLIPLIALLIWAVSVRVNEYGITEQRYFLIVLAIWLSFITIYFLFSKRQDIRIIPISLCLVTLFSVYGLQGAFSVSKSSQIKQLEKLFIKYNSFRDNRLQPVQKRIDSADNERMRNIIGYLLSRHGFKSLEAISPVDPEKIEKHYVTSFKTSPPNREYQDYQIRQEVKDSLFRFWRISDRVLHNEGIETKRLRDFRVEQDEVIDIKGYQRLIVFNSNLPNQEFPVITSQINGQPFSLKIDPKNNLQISLAANAISVDPKELLEKLLTKAKSFKQNPDESYLIVPVEEMTLERNLQNLQLTIRFDRVKGGYERYQNKDILFYSGMVLIK
ncbi:MAG TPA: DUF4153 domain-containing protein [Daejeonella sp.]|nr:DUF4153 domain-containing protein [Daejeonella sp.]